MSDDAWAAYFYPETFDEATRYGTLRNLLGLRDAGELAHAEYLASAWREQDLARGAAIIPQTFDAGHLSAIHRHLLQDVYEWAGQWRTVELAKGKGAFASIEFGDVKLHLEYARRGVHDRSWMQMGQREFAEAAGEVFAHINQAHPFREGNGRASKVFMNHVAQLAGRELDYRLISPAVWNAAAEASRPPVGEFTPNGQPMATLFAAIARPSRQRAEPSVDERIMRAIEGLIDRAGPRPRIEPPPRPPGARDFPGGQDGYGR